MGPTSVFVMFAIVGIVCGSDPAQTKVKDAKACDDCKSFFDDIENIFLGPDVEANALDRMKHMCERLPTKLGQFCDQVTFDWVNNFFKFIHKRASPEIICNILPFCGDDEELLKAEEPVKEDGPVCMLCEMFMGQITNVFGDNQLKTDIEEFTQSLMCSFLPTPFGGLCRDEVKSAIDMFFDIFNKELASDSWCSIFGLCGSQGPGRRVLVKSIASHMKGLSLYSPIVRHALRENLTPVVDKAFDVVHANIENLNEGPLCAVCESVLGGFKSLVNDPNFKRQLELFTDGLACSFLPQPLKGFCIDELDRVTDIFFDFFKTELADDNMCTLIGLCSPTVEDFNLLSEKISKTIVNFHKVRQQITEKDGSTMLDRFHAVLNTHLSQKTSKAEVGESPQCTLCKDVLGQFEAVLTNPELKADIEYLSEVVLCAVLPGQLKTLCKSEVDRFMDVIFDIIKMSTNATTICEMFGICYGPDSLECGLTKHLTPIVKEALHKAVQPVLPVLSKRVEDGETAVMEHISTLITEKYPHLTVKQDVGNTAACNVCRRVMDLIKQLMGDAQFKSDVEEMGAEFLCPFLPKTFQGMCKLEINQIVSMFFDMLDTELDVQIMCDFLGMCQDDGKFRLTLNEYISSSKKTLTIMAEAALPALQLLQKVKEEHGECALCETVVNQFISFLENDHSQKEIVAAGEKYCQLLPESLASQCEGFVQQNAVKIMEMFVNNLTPKTVCSAAAMCDVQASQGSTPVVKESRSKDLLTILGAAPEEKTQMSLPQKELPILRVKKERRAPWCDICETVSATVNAFLGSAELERVAISVGDSVCMLMPNGLKFPCDSFVRQFFEEFLGDVSSFLTPDFVCGVIGVCYVEFTPMNYTNSQFLHPSFHHVL